ncbi:MAG: class I SAM-dependent methyltransferase [Actinomycetota bacterium]
MFAGIADGYERRGSRLSLGREPGWRAYLVSRLRSAPDARVLDVATGTGAVAAEIALRYGCHVVAVDQSPEMLAQARVRLAERGVADRVELVQAQAEDLPFDDDAFDAATFTYLLRYVDDPLDTLREIVRVVHPGGTVASLEFGVPSWPPARIAWRAYTGAVLPVAGRLMSREWGAAMRFLAQSVPDFDRRYPLPALLDLYRAAGLEDVRMRRLTFGAGVVIWGRRPVRIGAGAPPPAAQ